MLSSLVAGAFVIYGFARLATRAASVCHNARVPALTLFFVLIFIVFIPVPLSTSETSKMMTKSPVIIVVHVK